MKIITDDHILLSHNIISIYTNIEKYIDMVDDVITTGMLVVDNKVLAELNNYLSIQASNPQSVFIGLFYNVDPIDFNLEICWTLLKNNKAYQTFIEALAEDSVFDLCNNTLFEERNRGSDTRITIIESGYDSEFAPDEDDEFDLELNLDDTILDDDDD